MSPVKSFLLSRAEVLGVYGDTYYNRVTLANNSISLNRSRCWVHQTASDIKRFPIEQRVECSCGFNRQGLASCAQKQYIDSCLERLWEDCKPEERTGIVSFGNTRCAALLLNDGVHLFSTFQACGTGQVGSYGLGSGDVGSFVPDKHKDIICPDCREVAGITVPKLSDVVTALKDMVHKEVHEGITLMKQFPIKPGEHDVYDGISQAQEVAKAVAMLEGLVVNEDQPLGSFEMGADTGLIQSCNDLAESLIQACQTQLVAVCSTLVGHVNSVCQPPLKVHLRWLQHYMALEYRIEYTPDYTNCFFDEISGRYAIDVDKEKVVLHEIVQCSQISLLSVEGCFRLGLKRMQDYLYLRQAFNAKNEVDTHLPLGNDAASFNTSDVAPFWWNYYSFSNTLGEGDANPEHYSVKRLTRSQILKSHDDGASTPIARKARHSLEDHLVATHCVSSDTLGHSQVTTFEAPTNNRKDLSDFHRSDHSNTTLNTKSTPSVSQRLLKFTSSEGSNLLCNTICFCFKCLAAVSTFGRHFVTQEFAEHNSISCAVFGVSPYTEGLEDIYNGCHVDEWDEYQTASALRRSIKAALEASSSLGRALVNDQRGAKIVFGNSIKILNTALLSTLRLGDCLYITRNAMEKRLGEQDIPVREYYDTGDPVEDGGSDDSCSSESTLRDIISNSFVLSNGYQGLYSTFENDQYIQHDLDESEDTGAFHSPSTNAAQSPPRRSTGSPRTSGASHARNSNLDHHLENSRGGSRRSGRDTGEVYVYDLSERNDAMSESPAEDWYDSDSSVRGSRRQRQKQNTSSLTEIYGNQDALIPMGPLPIGVYFDASRKLWRCQWRENGKFRTKGFSLGHYSSLCEARRACILFRCQVGNMPVQPEWLNPNYVQVSQLLSKRSTATSTSTSTPKKSKRKRRSGSSSMDIDPIK
ncbi:transcription factor with AP2 domain(s) [Babesia ovis]|uniref:Transcription factor with AP2 domain(S) n=1 Tax=Babesia ovis TaxID=5869 RepID=A0A9W5TC20_BABOV|nr:transcription factor with AP2 domain(s) [Babesia ovis]